MVVYAIWILSKSAALIALVLPDGQANPALLVSITHAVRTGQPCLIANYNLYCQHILS